MQLMQQRFTRTVLLGWTLCAVFCGDLTLQNFDTLKSIIVPVSALSVTPLPNTKSLNSRIYRFMAFDSDLYLNNSMAAVAERVIRLQPNLPGIRHISVTDGYEEGLLPTRVRANLFRKFNRNFRSDSPDPALLGFLGSDTMLTEFPLPHGNEWTPVSNAYKRPDVVPYVAGEPTSYQFWKSDYTINTPVLDLNRLLQNQDADQWLKDVKNAFPPHQDSKVPTSQEWVQHPLSLIKSTQFRDAQENIRVSNYQWNRITIDLTSQTTEALVLIPPYPGWKLEDSSAVPGHLNFGCSMFYLLEVSSPESGTSREYMVFAPYSFRVGLFISLISMIVLILIVTTRVCDAYQSSRRRQKI